MSYPIADVPEGMTHQYIISIRAGRPTHMWTLANETGAIHIHGWHYEGTAFGREWMGGVETHSAKPFDYSNEKPDHECCWLLGKPCWHDGTSLYFSERIAPMLEGIDPNAAMPDHIHGYMLSELKYWFRTHLAQVEDEAA